MLMCSENGEHEENSLHTKLTASIKYFIDKIAQIRYDVKDMYVYYDCRQQMIPLHIAHHFISNTHKHIDVRNNI